MRRSPLQRTARRTYRPHYTGPSQAVKQLVWARAEGCCERCALDVNDPISLYAFQLHHRRPRSAGGTSRPETNSAANLVLLCLACHSACESRRTMALAQGWLVLQHDEPASTPILMGERWWYLTGDGGKVAA